MEIPDSLQCLFTARTERRDGAVVIEIPESEIQNGSVSAGEVYQIALLARTGQVPSRSDSEASASPSGSMSDQPVQEGDVLEVEIEDIGDQGDGIARVGPGFVVIIPETEPGDHVTVEITDVGETVAFAEVLEEDDAVV